MASTETVFPHEPAAENHNTLGGARLIVGLVQGVALYLLYLAVDKNVWPASNAYWIVPLLMVFVFVPPLFIQAVGTMRLRTLVIWTVAVTAILSLLGWLDVWRQWDSSGAKPPGDSDGDMTFALVAFTIVGLFIAQALITAADFERKYVASYSAYFEAAWKLEIQLLLSAVFVGVFWGVLWLGAVLFNLINLHFIEDLIEKPWFAIPASSLAAAAALHVTDVRGRLVAGIRTVAHTLLSWLLPLMVLIAVGFTFSLPFTGLQPLWATKSAAGLLLTAAGVLVILINAAFQDGDPQHNRALVMRWSEFAAALVLIPFVLIATYALSLRVGQYGWTVERILTAATIVVALTYAFGYAAAALLSLRGSVWMALVSRVNIAAAFLVLGILLLLFTPVADPARLAVDSQVARIGNGVVKPEAFDYDYLRTEGGRYGRAALNLLANRGQTETVRRMAKAALNGQSVTQATPPAQTDLKNNLTIYPKDRTLPDGLVTQDWTNIAGAPACLTTASSPCDVFFGDFDGDGGEDVVFVSHSGAAYFWGTIMTRSKDKAWAVGATINGNCAGMLDALKNGQASLQPRPNPWRDWVVLGVHLHPVPNVSDYEPCPQH